jgi:hypothetical protein
MSDETKDETKSEAQEKPRVITDLNAFVLGEDELSSFRQTGRAAAAIWIGAQEELRRLGVHDQSAYSIAFRLTTDRLEKLFDHSTHAQQESAEEEKIRETNRAAIGKFLEYVLRFAAHHGQGS